MKPNLPTPAFEIEALIRRIEAGEVDLSIPKATSHLRCTGEDAERILRAATEPCVKPGVSDCFYGLEGTLAWGGTTTSNLRLYNFDVAQLKIGGTILGTVDIQVTYAESIVVDAAVHGGIHVDPVRADHVEIIVGQKGPKPEHIFVGGEIEDMLRIHGGARWGDRPARAVDVRVQCTGSPAIRLSLDTDRFCEIRGSHPASIGLTGSIGRECGIAGAVSSDVVVSAAISGGLDVYGQVGGELLIDGEKPILGDLTIRADVGRLLLDCDVEGDVNVQGSAPIGRLPALTSARSIVLHPAARLGDCDLRRFAAWDALRLLGEEHFPLDSKRRRHLSGSSPSRKRDHRSPFRDPSSPDETVDQLADSLTLSESQAVYRHLRAVAERAGGRQTAADFYFHEMQARREMARRWSSEHATLTAYYHASRYATRELPPLLWLLLLLGLTTLFHRKDLESWAPATVDSLRVLLPFAGTSQASSGWVSVWDIAIALASPVLLAQLALAIRDRVARW